MCAYLVPGTYFFDQVDVRVSIFFLLTRICALFSVLLVLTAKLPIMSLTLALTLKGGSTSAGAVGGCTASFGVALKNRIPVIMVKKGYTPPGIFKALVRGHVLPTRIPPIV